MAEPLKNSFGPDIPKRIGRMISGVHPAFDQAGFVADVIAGYEPLELKERGLKITRSLRAFLPADYEKAIEVLLGSMGPTLDESPENGMAPFLYFPHVYFVHEYGLEHFEASMQAQYELTQRFTAEFSIRPFLEQHTTITIDRLRKWTRDESQHVRRLVSEGTRPRLPWASRLRNFQKDPTPVLELLELLKDDSELYVRRSVANNLNDIGKDHPELLIGVARKWMKAASENRKWVVRHGLRTAVKRADAGALDVLGYGDHKNLVVTDASISPDDPKMGGHFVVSFTLTNSGSAPKPALVDFRVHYVKANGSANPKVFKLKEIELQAGESVRLSKKVSLKEMTTRKHYPGTHRIEAIVNGSIMPLGDFALSKP